MWLSSSNHVFDLIIEIIIIVYQSCVVWKHLGPNGSLALPAQFAAARLLSPAPPAAGTNGTAEAVAEAFLSLVGLTLDGPLRDASELLGSAPPEPPLARPRPCCIAAISFSQSGQCQIRTGNDDVRSRTVSPVRWRL